MPARKLEYQVSADTGTAISDLRKLGDAGAQAGKAIGDGFTDGASKSEQAIANMITGLDKVAAESRETIAATARLGEAFGEGFDPEAGARMVSSLRRAGAEFDDIEAKATELAATLKRVDDVKVDAATAGIHNLGREADQSRSVLANMAGNTTQSLAQLGGVTGDLGVGLGQLAEYASEGNIGLQGLVGVAGPMAGLAAATFLVGEAMGEIGKEAKEAKEQTDKYREVLGEAGDAATNVADMVRKAGTLSFADNNADTFLRDLAELLPLVGEGTVNVADIFQRASLNVDNYSDSVAGVGDAWNTTVTALSMARTKGLISADEFRDVVAEMEDQRNRIGAAGSDTATFFAQSIESLNKAFQQLKTGDDPMAVMGAQWRILVDDLRNGTINTQDAVDAVAALSAQLGKSPPEIIQIAWERLNKVWDDATESADRARAAQLEAARAAGDAAHQLSEAMTEIKDVTAGTDWGAASIQATSDAMGRFFTQATAGADAVAGVQEALDNLAAAHEAGETLLPDLSTPEGRQTMQALEQLGSSLIPEIQKAFDDSRGSVTTFGQKMDGLYLRTLAQLSNQLNISTTDAAELLAQIGLTPENFETQYKLIGDAAALQQLSLLQGAISNLPADVQNRITYQIAMGDYQGAVQTVLDHAQKHPAVIPGRVDMTGADADIDALRKRTANNPLFIPATVQVTRTVGVTQGFSKSSTARSTAAAAGVSAMSADLLGADGEPVADAAAVSGNGWTPTMLVAPARPPVTINVEVKAAVIGSRADVQRAVLGAMADAERLGRVPA